VRLPYWAIALLLLGGGLPRLYAVHARRRRARRIASNRCGACGYDLRGSAARCPECGVEARGSLT
jgi:hypothetical protein